VRYATWHEIDLDARLWTVPAERMKMDREHRVPLSDTALAVLAEAKALAVREGELVFPSPPGRDKPIADTAFFRLLQEQLKVEKTAHGFRSSFRDWAEEATSFLFEAKELALAHAVKDKTECAYRRGDLLDQRRPLMNDWAAYATGGGKVVRLAHG